MESDEEDVNFTYKIGQKVFYAGVPYGVLDRYIDDSGAPYYMIRPFTREGVSYSGLPVPEEALRPVFKDSDAGCTVSQQ
jgi:hypothetical protein